MSWTLPTSLASSGIAKNATIASSCTRRRRAHLCSRPRSPRRRTRTPARSRRTPNIHALHPSQVVTGRWAGERGTKPASWAGWREDASWRLATLYYLDNSLTRILLWERARKLLSDRAWSALLSFITFCPKPFDSQVSPSSQLFVSDVRGVIFYQSSGGVPLAHAQSTWRTHMAPASHAPTPCKKDVHAPSSF